MEKILDDVRRDAITKLRMSDKNVEILAEAADRIILFAKKAHKYGIFSLEAEAKYTNSECLKSTVMLAVDMCDLETFIEEATAAYWAWRLEGAWAMVNYMYIRGMFLILRGADPDQSIAPMLQSLIPKEQRPEFKERMASKEQHRKEIFEKYTQIWRPVFLYAGLSEKVHALKRTLPQDIDIWGWARKISDMKTNDLAACIYAMDPEIRQKIMDTLSGLRSIKCMFSIMEDIVHYHQTEHDETDMAKSVSIMLSRLT